MEVLIAATILEIRNQIAMSNRETNKQTLMELVPTATSLDISKKTDGRNKGMNKQISQRTKNEQKLF